MFHCMFEQSGTFKNIFKKYGYEAEDYDILNDFGETDHVVDLFSEINKAYENLPSIFDNVHRGGEDMILAFYPCTRFETQIQMGFKGTLYQFAQWTDEQKLEYDLKLHEELHQLYMDLCKLTLVCIRRNIPLVVENPYSKDHYLYRYWCMNPKVVDYDRSKKGDYYKKPTQYFFINCEPKCNLIPEGYTIKKRGKSVEYTTSKVQRSMISSEYADRFIRENILDIDEYEEIKKDVEQMQWEL